MNADTRLLRIDGPVGIIDVALDEPSGVPLGTGIVAHPHPLHGGTRDNKVAQTLARALLALGFAVWRPNFRGVGASAGTHDEGRGETDDLLAVIQHARAQAADPSSPLVLAGFSFGTHVQIRVAERLRAAGQPAQRLVLVGTAVRADTPAEVPEDTILIHGEQDDVVPLISVLDWARPQSLPVTVFPGTGHFFHRRLTQLKHVVIDALAPRTLPAPQ